MPLVKVRTSRQPVGVGLRDGRCRWRSMMVVSSARACSTVTPSASRPITVRSLARRLSHAVGVERQRRPDLRRRAGSGNHSAPRRPLRTARRRAAPIVPTMSRLEPKRRTHRSWPRTTRRLLARLAFIGVKVAAKRQGRAERGEEPRRHPEPGHLLGNVDARQVGVPPFVDRPAVGRCVDSLLPFAEIGAVTPIADREASGWARGWRQ